MKQIETEYYFSLLRVCPYYNGQVKHLYLHIIGQRKKEIHFDSLHIFTEKYVYFTIIKVFITLYGPRILILEMRLKIEH